MKNKMVDYIKKNIWNIIAGLGSIMVAFGVFLAYNQLRLSKEIAMADFAIRLDQQFNSLKMEALRKKVCQLDFTKPEKAEDFSRIIDFFETIAHLEKRGVIDFETVDEMWGWWIENYWVLGQSYLKYWWKKEPGSYDLTQKLFNRLERQYIKDGKEKIKQKTIDKEIQERINKIEKKQLEEFKKEEFGLCDEPSRSFKEN